MSKEKEYITTIADFEYFKNKVKYFIELFGLKDWEYQFKHSKVKDPTQYAGITYSCRSRNATITLEKYWGDLKPSRKELALTAFHEVAELVLAKLRDMSGIISGPYDNESVVDAEIHKVIYIFQNAMLNESFKDK